MEQERLIKYKQKIKELNIGIQLNDIHNLNDLFDTLIDKIKYQIEEFKIKSENYSMNKELCFLISNAQFIENMLLSEDKNNKLRNLGDIGDMFKTKEQLYILQKEILDLSAEKAKLEKSLKEIKQNFFDYQKINAELANDFDNFDKYQKINEECSQKISNFYSKKQFKEASLLWEKCNYQPLKNYSLDRSFEILAFLVKLKNKQIMQLIKEKKDYQFNDNDKKNKEIIELLSENELLKTKLSQFEMKIYDLKNRENTYMLDNNDLFSQNKQLKYLLNFK